ncbi:MAG: cache domain-containing protein [Deltaproteobacteria bacterium]|nr:cache domain-containing protein [Deltaproteobacteria bacterium]MBZ0220615.1 cache domain-containing protein [Deltaproteobacteria bacterium]
MNIGSKLILSFLIATLLPTVFLAFFTTNLISDSRREDAEETISNNLKAAWMQYYSRAYQMQYGMLQASTEGYMKTAMKDRDKALLRSQLIAWKEYRPHVDLWAVVDPGTRTIASLNTRDSGRPISLNGLVEKAFGSRESIISTEIVPHQLLKAEGLDGAASITAEDGKILGDGLMLVVVTPVVDGKGSVLGAIISGDLVSNDPFVPDTLAESIPGSLAAISMGGTQVSTNGIDDDGIRAVGRLIPEPVLAELERNLGYRGEIEVAGKAYMAAFDPIRDNAGRVIGSLFVGIPKEKFVELQYTNIKAIATIALIGIFMATGVASFLTYVITRPILSLKKKAQLVAAGDLNIRMGPVKAGNDEIADLARTFEKMVESLRDKEESIRVSQEKLATQKKLVESIINSLPYALYVLERNKSVVVRNRHATEACPAGECEGPDGCIEDDFISHFPQELREELTGIVEGVFETGEPRSAEYRLGTPDGERIMLTSVFPVVAGDARPAEFVVWMSEDITRKKELELNIISSEKLAAVGQLAAGIAHEVNNPLGGILNCLYNLRNRKLTDERKAEYVDFMEDGIKRVQNIVRQLLDFSQQHAPELSLTDINSIIEGIIPLFRHSVRGKEVRLLVNLSQGLPRILVDRHQIEQILVNLILNAVQAVSSEGLIEVTTRRDGNWFCIQIADNGCGIPQENLGRVFDPFFTTKGVGRGTGLGLSVSRGIIERHKGRIEVESQPGKGSTFRVLLPIGGAEEGV